MTFSLTARLRRLCLPLICLALISCSTDGKWVVESSYPAAPVASDANFQPAQSVAPTPAPTEVIAVKQKPEAGVGVPPIPTMPLPLTPDDANVQGVAELLETTPALGGSLTVRDMPGGIFVGEAPVPHATPAPENVPAAEQTGTIVATTATPQAPDTTLNFVNADLRDVAKAVLGDMLGLNYTLSPNVKGVVTIKTNRPLNHKDIVPTLNIAFRVNGATIVESGNVYKVVPINEALQQGAPISDLRGTLQPGFGLQVVQLDYVSIEEMQRVLAPVAPQGGVIPVASSRNVLMLAGTESERAAMMEVVDTFDVDWLAGMSFGLFPLKEASSRILFGELWEVLGTPSGPLGKIVKLVSLDRLNAILAISSQPKYIHDIKKWIERLDFDKAPADQKIWVYPVQNGKARDLAETLEKLVAGQKSAASTPGAAPSLAPSSMGAENGAGAANLPSLDTMVLGSTTSAPRIIADETTNALIIMATKGDFSLIEAALKKLDITPLQVRIEAVIAEVTLTDDLRYGVQYFFRKGDVGTILTNSQTLNIASTLPGFSAFVMGSNIRSILDLLQSRTSIRVISSPQLMVVNNQSALLQVGDQVPVASQQAVSVLTPGAPVVNTIQMRDTGVILKVTPRVNASGMVNMDVSQEVSDVARTTTSTLDSPTIQQRKISSSVVVRDGETIALGGLIRDNNTDGRDGIPLLQDIPVFGSLFSTTSETGTRTELLALITPRVVRNDADVRLVTEEMRQQMHAVAPLDLKIH